jgi:hypothetical protein
MTEPEFSRPATLDDLKLLLRSLQNHGAAGMPWRLTATSGLPLTSICWFLLRHKQANM